MEGKNGNKVEGKRARDLVQQHKYLPGKNEVVSSIPGTSRPPPKKVERKKGWKEERGMGGKRIKIYYVWVQIPYDKCDQYVWQICTNKKSTLKKQRKWSRSQCEGLPTGLLLKSRNHLRYCLVAPLTYIKGLLRILRTLSYYNSLKNSK